MDRIIISSIKVLFSEFFKAWSEAEPLQLSEINAQDLLDIIDDITQKIEKNSRIKSKIIHITNPAELSNIMTRLGIWSSIVDPIIESHNYYWNKDQSRYVAEENKDQLSLFEV